MLLLRSSCRVSGVSDPYRSSLSAPRRATDGDQIRYSRPDGAEPPLRAISRSIESDTSVRRLATTHRTAPAQGAPRDPAWACVIPSLGLWSTAPTTRTWSGGTTDCPGQEQPSPARGSNPRSPQVSGAACRPIFRRSCLLVGASETGERRTTSEGVRSPLPIDRCGRVRCRRWTRRPGRCG
jgi:hypothetical protein